MLGCFRNTIVIGNGNADEHEDEDAAEDEYDSGHVEALRLQLIHSTVPNST